MLKTSKYLLKILSDTDEDFQDGMPDTAPDRDSSSDLAQTVFGHLKHSLFAFSNARTAAVLKLIPPEYLEDSFDDYFTRQFLKQASKIAERAARLSPIVPVEKPSAKTAQYLREATNSYVLGSFGGCIALCRATVEQALKEGLQRSECEDTSMAMGELIKAASWFGVIDSARESMASRVQFAGNQCMHGCYGSNREETAWDTLCSARGVLEYIFAGTESRN